ncbi:hypothetical protein MFFC18_07850 [Mariniblastus fucicola]|uniref:Uncharacterized protein n=1 Tax=Mariniblastus fucicola TaxID=980251 RepID=A0A5B9P3Z1_9BACT|nr:hypothetical protein MFFC18_07850 [Mariniblastus fucicola]
MPPVPARGKAGFRNGLWKISVCLGGFGRNGLLNIERNIISRGIGFSQFQIFIALSEYLFETTFRSIYVIA